MNFEKFVLSPSYLIGNGAILILTIAWVWVYIHRVLNERGYVPESLGQFLFSIIYRIFMGFVIGLIYSIVLLMLW